MRKLALVTALSLSVVVGLAACSSDSSDSSGSSGSSTTTKAAAKVPVSLCGTVNNTGTKDISADGATAKIEVEADNFYFNPTFIKAAPSQKVTVELKNEGTVAHTFTLDALNIDKEVQPGESAEVEVTAPANGDAPFFCRFHKDNGMQGALFIATS
jgi:plastocyanin